MFFTPGRVLGLIVFVVILLVLTYLLKRLESLLGPAMAEAAPNPGPPSANGITPTVVKDGARVSPGKTKRQRKRLPPRIPSGR